MPLSDWHVKNRKRFAELSLGYSRVDSLFKNVAENWPLNHWQNRLALPGMMTASSGCPVTQLCNSPSRSDSFIASSSTSFLIWFAPLSIKPSYLLILKRVIGFSDNLLYPFFSLLYIRSWSRVRVWYATGEWRVSPSPGVARIPSAHNRLYNDVMEEVQRTVAAGATAIPISSSSANVFSLAVVMATFTVILVSSLSSGW